MLTSKSAETCALGSPYVLSRFHYLDCIKRHFQGEGIVRPAARAGGRAPA